MSALERDRLSYEAEIGYWKSLYRSEKQQKDDARSAWNELCAMLESKDMANSILTDERDALKAELERQGDAQAALMSLARQYNLVVRERNEIAGMYNQALENAQAAQAEIATMQAELSALQPDIDPAIDADVQRQFRALWDSCSENERKYRYCAPSAIYPPRVGRRRTFKYYSHLHRHQWFGGAVNKEIMALAKHEGLYATPRELARLRAYTDDWDGMSMQGMLDSIPW